MKQKINVITMGCSKNLVDSEFLMRQVENIPTKYEIFHENTEKDFDIIIINTCGFINDAKEESIEKIFAYIDAKKRGEIKKLFVIGCLSERYKKDLIKEMPEVDGFFGTTEIPKILDRLELNYDYTIENERKLSTPNHYAYLKIAEGCNRHCSFCAIPLIRGKYQSKTIETLYKETLLLTEKGVKELLIIAQDTSYYGYDIYKKYKLTELINKLSEIDKLEWIKVHYLYPAQFPYDLLETMRDNPKVCNYIDLALQHVSNKVLNAMNRNITTQETYSLIEKIRNTVPNVVLRTTLMSGFPGETISNHREMIKFIKAIKFERLGIFTYSHEEQTPSFKKFEDKISAKTKQRRADELMEIQRNISYEFNLSLIGSKQQIIIDRKEGDNYIGRTSFDSPDVDGEVIITTKKEIEIGSFQQVIINNADDYDLYADF